MAALPETRMPDVVDLHEIRVEDLERVLAEEELTWRAKLYWDFAPSADLVRRFVRMQALSGYALMSGGDCIGYSYFVSEDRKALIGDLYVLNRHARPELEDVLLGAVLNALAATPGLHRIEAQLMMMHGAFERPLPYGRYLHIHPRNLMLVEGGRAPELPKGRAARRYAFAPWREEDQEEAALLIAGSYHGHVDSTINDQYRTASGARRFLNNIVQYPGCGVFQHAASLTARVGNRMVGLCLTSRVADNVGHITQICVLPEAQGTGVGYELLRRSLLTLCDAGCESVSLTVTAANQQAVGLYQNMGFRAVRHFAAYVWDDL